VFTHIKIVAELSRTQIATMNGGRGGNIKYAPFAFSELGVAMLSSVLHSKAAIEINRGIMRAFVRVRQMLSGLPADEVKQLQRDVRALREYVEDVLVDQNDINEDTRVQLELINQSLAEMQTRKKAFEKPARHVGFTASRERDNE
jgi:hypothetical protein